MMDLEKAQALGLKTKMLKALERERVKALGLAWEMEMELVWGTERAGVCR
jgi:hypothetical protein